MPVPSTSPGRRAAIAAVTEAAEAPATSVTNTGPSPASTAATPSAVWVAASSPHAPESANPRARGSGVPWPVGVMLRP